MCGIAYYVGICVCPFALGGLLFLLLFEIPGPVPEEESAAIIAASALSVGLLMLVLIPGAILMRHSRKRLLFGTVWGLTLLIVTLAVVELSLRSSTPSWPASDLHGVPHDFARRAWGRVEPSGNDGVNDWGQRDRPRSIRRSPGDYRLAFIGDSFLEESSTVPLSLRVEQKIGRPDVEVLNLGVSATDPDEYCYRARNVALPLDCQHCVLFVYAGNDFTAPERTLSTSLGITAVSPRGSLLSTLGLRRLNHLAMNRQRPVLQTWFAAGDLSAREDRLAEMIRQADDARLRDLLYSLDYHKFSPMQRDRLAARLNTPEMVPFFEMLRQPDQGLFRSYYLSAALWSASVGGGQWEPLSITATAHWIDRTADLCRDRGVRFTLVIIPEAFQVDLRMAEQWLPLTDMTTLTRSTREASGRLAQWAAWQGMHVIDLHDVLGGQRGTYLNLDGHWSDHGVEVVSDFLATALQDEWDDRQ